MRSVWMVLSVALLGLLAVQAADPPASLRNIVKRNSLKKRVSMLNPQFGSRVPRSLSQDPVKGPLTPADFENQQPETSPFSFGDNVNLQWLKWNGSLPNGAVAVYSGYNKRTDYVCKFNCESGFYTSRRDPYCHYPYGNKEHKVRDFDLLVNKDNFELLEWTKHSYGSVPTNAVRTCTQGSVYVGKNK